MFPLLPDGYRGQEGWIRPQFRLKTLSACGDGVVKEKFSIHYWKRSSIRVTLLKKGS
jgi:hypothetical protein